MDCLYDISSMVLFQKLNINERSSFRLFKVKESKIGLELFDALVIMIADLVPEL